MCILRFVENKSQIGTLAKNEAAPNHDEEQIANLRSDIGNLVRVQIQIYFLQI